MKNKIVFLIVFFSVFNNSFGQYSISGDSIDDEGVLYARTKQVNQFFRRFNGEEDINGNRYYPKDKHYRDNKLRKKYLDGLFDNQSSIIGIGLKNSFIEDITKDRNSQFVDFHGGRWCAEVETEFNYYKKKVNISLFFEIEEENLGSKWVLTHVYFEKFNEYFAKGNTGKSKFLHPLSHEIDFMNLRKVFDSPKSIQEYAIKTYKTDFMTLFFYEVKNSNLKFDHVKNVKFHFFQMKDWYFELSEYNRPERNSGWLISNLIKVKENEKENILKFIYHEEN